MFDYKHHKIYKVNIAPSFSRSESFSFALRISNSLFVIHQKLIEQTPSFGELYPLSKLNVQLLFFSKKKKTFFSSMEYLY